MKTLTLTTLALLSLSFSALAHAEPSAEDAEKCGKMPSCYEASQCARDINGNTAVTSYALSLAASNCAKDFGKYQLESVYQPLKDRCQSEWGKTQGTIRRILSADCVLSAAEAVHSIQDAIEDQSSN
jgi:hypothetical protein